MFHLFAHRRRHVWIAILAILWHGLLPMSYASIGASPIGVPATHGVHHSMCDAAAHHDGCAAENEAPAKHGTTHHRAHCALCFFDSSAPLLHDARDPLVIASSSTYVLRDAVTPHSHTAHVSAPPPSRAPPFAA